MMIFDELQARGLIHQFTLPNQLKMCEFLSTTQCLYAGFDPSAPSLHVGNLIPLLCLKRFQLAGHRVIALVGGATGQIGDPSGRSSERNLSSLALVQVNKTKIMGQLSSLLGSGELVDNLDWLKDMSLLDFLRDIGKHFTVNTMLRKDSVKNRLVRDGDGLSFTEFSYSLLQGFDFLHLSRTRGVSIQLGGSDQWGNITAGTDLVRRADNKTVHGITFPLLTNSDGSKFGKSAGNAIWLDPKLTSPFDFRQFWVNTDDADVIARLRLFTFLSLDEINEFVAGLKTNPGAAQRKLAREMTVLVHGTEIADSVEQAADALFRNDPTSIPAAVLVDALKEAPKTVISRAALEAGIPLIDLIVKTVHKGAQARGKARREIEVDKCISLNGVRRVSGPAQVGLADLLHDRFLVIKKGKRSFFLVEVS